MQQVPSTTAILCDFMEIAFHTILYTRRIYPPEIFERRRKFGIPVHLSRHPDLSKYLVDVVCGIQSWLEADTLQKVVLAVLGPQNQDNNTPSVIERFVFNLTLSREQEQAGQRLNLTQIQQLEEKLRASLLKLQVCDAKVPALPLGSTFTVLLYTDTDDQSKQDWFAIEERELVEVPRELYHIPIKSVNTDLFQIQIHMENKNLEYQASENVAD